MMDDTLKFLADFQAREIAGIYCALCGNEYTDLAADNPIFVGEVAINSRSVHSACWVGFQLLCEHMRLDWRAAVDWQRTTRTANIPPLGKPPAWAITEEPTATE